MSEQPPKSQMSSFEYAQRKQEDALRYQLEFSEVIERVRKYLEGLYYDEQTRTYIAYQTDGQGNPIPLMNQKGIALVMRTLVGLDHKGIVLANLTHEEATEWAKQVHRSIAKTLFIHGAEIEVAPSDLREITMNISMNVYSAFTRAIGGDTAEQLNRIVTVHEEKSQREGGVFNRG